MISNEEFNQDNPNPFLITESIFRIEAVKNLLSEAYPNQSNPDYDFLINLQELMQMHQEYWKNIPGGMFEHGKLVEKLAYKGDVTLENYQAYIHFLKQVLSINLSEEILREIYLPYQKKINFSHRLNILGVVALLGCIVLGPPVFITLSISISSLCLLFIAQYLKNITQFQRAIIEEIKKLSTTDNMIEPATLTPEA